MTTTTYLEIALAPVAAAGSVVAVRSWMRRARAKRDTWLDEKRKGEHAMMEAWRKQGTLRLPPGGPPRESP